MAQKIEIGVWESSDGWVNATPERSNRGDGAAGYEFPVSKLVPKGRGTNTNRIPDSNDIKAQNALMAKLQIGHFKKDTTAPTGGDVQGKELSVKKYNVAGLSTKHAKLFSAVEEAVYKYRKQSAFHFAVYIDVQWAVPNKDLKCKASKRRSVLVFQNYNQQIYKTCRQHLPGEGSDRRVQVRVKRSWIPIEIMLNQYFPPFSDRANLGTLAAYWEANGKFFNWKDLPTELKENIIQYCFVELPKSGGDIHMFRCQKIARARSGGRSSCEISEHLGPWKALLMVSTQVRAITLRLRLAGGLVYKDGLHIRSSNYFDFQGRLRRFDRRSQITESYSVPPQNDPENIGHLLQQAYRDSPKLYPELHRYATFFHGIRQVDISFAFIDLYRFFQVTAGGFDRQKKRERQKMTFEVFDRMPFLNKIVVRFPKNRLHFWNNYSLEPERPLFHEDFPCPRVIMRILYERIAEALAAYNDVKVMNFLNELEKGRFLDMRRAARKKLDIKPQSNRLTIEQLLELNNHTGTAGGIQFSRHDYEPEHAGVPMEAVHFYPIKCKCAVPCREEFNFCI